MSSEHACSSGCYPTTSPSSSAESTCRDCACAGCASNQLNTLSVVSLGASASYFGAVAGIITGHVALRQLKTSQQRGRWAALTGVAAGYAIVASWLLLGVLVLAAKVAFLSGVMGGAAYEDWRYSQPMPLSPNVYSEPAPYVFADPYRGPNGGYISTGPYMGPDGGYIELNSDSSSSSPSSDYPDNGLWRG